MHLSIDGYQLFHRAAPWATLWLIVARALTMAQLERRRVHRGGAHAIDGRGACLILGNRRAEEEVGRSSAAHSPSEVPSVMGEREYDRAMLDLGLVATALARWPPLTLSRRSASPPPPAAAGFDITEAHRLAFLARTHRWASRVCGRIANPPSSRTWMARCAPLQDHD